MGFKRSRVQIPAARFSESLAKLLRSEEVSEDCGVLEV